jgi:hypothetical protein
MYRVPKSMLPAALVTACVIAGTPGPLNTGMHRGICVGVAIGLAAALAAARLLSTFLYGISPHDALTFVAVPIVIVTVAAIARLEPARRAVKMDPLTALRAG